MKFLSRSILPVVLIIISTQYLNASPPDWVDNPGGYEFTATISGGIILSENGEQMGDEGDMFAAFDDAGDVRGLGLMLFPPFGPYAGTPVFEVQLRSNAGGDLLSFKYYDASADAVLDIAETYEFVINDILGDVINPITFNIQEIETNAPDWVDCPGCYEFTATISGGIILSESGEQMGDDGDIFAAFDEDGNVRGVGLLLFPPFGPYEGTPVFEVQLRSNAEGDLISYKYYDASADAILDIVETYEFVINDILGDVMNPIIFNIGSIIEECVDNDAALAPFDCAMGYANWGCDFLWGGVPISELCPVTCDACPAADVYGCMDSEAANYNPDATIDDGTCEYPCFDDDASVAPFTCGYAVTTWGCDFLWGGTPIGELCPESCGNCGGSDIEGCMNDTACNYNPDATIEDGSCLELDCAGECGGSAEIDECGICGGDGIPPWACDCNNNVDLGCGCGEAGPSGCDNVCGSTLENDACGVCGGDGSDDLGCGCFEPGPSGCDNVCGSTLENDACGVCGGDGSDDLGCGCFEPGPSGCDNVCGSTLENDACGVCGGDGSDDLGCGCFEPGPSGCDNVCGSTLELDECGVCGGNGIPQGACDCDENVEDCAGVCGGSSVWATMCEDTDGDGLGNPGSESQECIDGGRDITDGCDLPDLNLFLGQDGSVYYQSSEEIGGFQFNVDGATASSAAGGDAGDAGFMVSTGGSMVIGFSLTGATFGPGCGSITQVNLDGSATGLSGIVVSDATGNAIPFIYYAGGSELVLDCSDEYPDCAANEFDCAGECGGSAVIDECGVCGGDGVQQDCGCGSPGEFGIPDGDCDCDGNELDCADVCGGSSIWATMCEDTDGDGLGNPGSESQECIDGGRDITDGCDLPDLNLFLGQDGSVYYQSSEEIGGFQFNVDGATASSAAGGDAGDAGFMVSTGGSMVIGFSLTGATFGPGCGSITQVNLDGSATGLSGIVVSDATGNAIPFIYYAGGSELVLDCSDEYPDCADNFYDCAGDCGGSAELDACGVCGGDGSDDLGCGCFEPGPSGCDNVCGSTLENDDCGVCGGDNSSCADCAGVPNGDSWESDCGCVAADNSGDDCADCAGVPNGDNTEDNCGTCDNDSSNDCVQDCAGEWGGSAYEDNCGVCDADPSNDNADDLGCGCGEVGPSGCDNTCGSTLENDDCGVCGGDNSSCADCAGVPNGNAQLDDCGICGGDGSSCAAYVEASVTTTVDETVLENLEIFEDNFESLVETQLGLPEGSVEVTGVTVLSRADLEIQVDFAITLTEEELAGTDFSSSDDIEDAWSDVEEEIANEGIEFIYGCTDAGACNFNSEATIDDGSCLELDCAGECGGSTEIDECGVCGGDGIPQGSCDCDGNVDAGCGCGEAGPSGCDNVCGSTLENDDCGVCGGDNSSCADCAGVPNGDSWESDCGCVAADNSGDDCDDCAGVPNGDNIVDNCGTCDNDYSNDCVQDCAGEWGGSAYEDNCGVCDADPSNDNAVDLGCGCFEPGPSGCDNECGSTLENDDCDVCGGDNSTCSDCEGVPNGDSWESDCGCVAGNNSGDDCDDCAGVPNGPNVEDMCGTCDDDSSNDCLEDCFGVWGGTDYDQGCGCGVYDELPTDGCDDVCGSTATEDECGTCDDDSSNDCVEDCFGVWGGTDYDQGCGCGVYDELPTDGCDDVCGSTAELDDCGVCEGGNADMDCAGECFGTAEIDECGVCGGPGEIECWDGTFVCDTADCPEESTTIDYCLDLHSGANLISFYGLPDDVSITHVMSSIEGNATGVIGEGVAANYNGVEWMGSLNNISSLSGYWVIVSEAGSLCIEDGNPTDPAIQYSLHSGANLISFPVEGSVGISSSLPDDIEGFVSGIIGEGVAANNQPPWQGSLSALSGGNGYWMITTENISFSFDVSTMSRIKYDEDVGLTAPDNNDIYQSTQQAFYFIEDIILDGMPVSNGDWILTYNGKTLVGARQWKGTFTDIPAMGYDGAFETEGYSNMGSMLTFKVQQNTTGKVYQIMDVVPAWKSNEIFTLGQLAAREMPDEVLLVSAYPNPFNPVTNITFGIENDAVVMAKVIDINGREVAELANGVYSAGYHVVNWNADSHSSGLYFLTIVIDDFASGNGQQFVQTQKLMLLK